MNAGTKYDAQPLLYSQFRATRFKRLYKDNRIGIESLAKFVSQNGDERNSSCERELQLVLYMDAKNARITMKISFPSLLMRKVMSREVQISVIPAFYQGSIQETILNEIRTNIYMFTEECSRLEYF